MAVFFRSIRCFSQSSVSRERGALAACGTRRASVHGGSLAASMPPRVPQPARTPRQTVGRLLFLKACCSACGSSCDVCSLRVESPFAARLATRKWSEVDRTLSDPISARHASFPLCTPTISTGPCPPTVAGPYAAWMPRKSLQGRTCGMSCDGGRARALQQAHSIESAARTPHRLPAVLLNTMHTDHLDWSLSAHRRGTLRGMDAA
ncbi:hypothetical protein GGR79_001543 [Xanthomonas arboricola]|nr:hypothetical protein [Xanthomonas arboricola]